MMAGAVATPMVWAVTNMTTQSGEYFYRLPAHMNGRIPSRTAHALEMTLGATTVIRPASDEMLHRAILASAAIPGLGKHGSLSAPAYERRGRRGP